MIFFFNQPLALKVLCKSTLHFQKEETKNVDAVQNLYPAENTSTSSYTFLTFTISCFWTCELKFTVFRIFLCVCVHMCVCVCSCVCISHVHE